MMLLRGDIRAWCELVIVFAGDETFFGRDLGGDFFCGLGFAVFGEDGLGVAVVTGDGSLND